MTLRTEDQVRDYAREVQALMKLKKTSIKVLVK